MKALLCGTGLGLLSLMMLSQLAPQALADHIDCSGCGSFAGFANFDAEVGIDVNRKFENDGDFVWCVSEGTPSHGGVSFDASGSEDVNNVTVTPAFFQPTECAEDIAVSVVGYLDELDLSGKCSIYGFVWPPTYDDYYMFDVIE